MPVLVTVVLPADPERLQIGGIASFVRGFTKFAPPDFDLAMVGIASGEKPRPVGDWVEVELEGRPLRFLPVSRRATTQRGRIPLALSFTAALRRNRRAIAQDRSILQFHRPGTALPLLGLRLPKVRVVHLTTDQLRSGGSESRWRLAGPVLDRLEARSFAAMDRVYVVNRGATDQLRHRFPRLAERIAFVPNWVDDTIFHPLPDSRRSALRHELLARLGLPSTTRLVLFAGRLERQKDPALLVDAFARLQRSDAGAALLVVGAGGLRLETERRVSDQRIGEGVRLLEPVPRHELAQLMNAADCMAITSAFETGPTVAYEALACGLPVVATAVGQIPELVRRGINGDVIEGRDPQAMADALRRVLELPAAAVRAASAQAAAPYRASAVLGRVYEDHRQLAAAGRS
ncbi:MAG TPA: glycosyltransferase family 4 protein [Candidatus Limnocylindrales bacterium]|nr:glycosyltransferase family 4 protein [Candidatus Limnocylindrales bacterium]